MPKRKPLQPSITPADEIRRLAKLEDEASQVRHRIDKAGKPVPMDIAYLEAVECVLENYDPRAIPYAQPFMQAWERSFRALAILVDEVDEIGEENEYVVPYGYWRHRDDAQAALFKEPPKKKRPPSPTQLRAASVSSRQIAIDWHWLCPDGSPDEDRVEREIEKPGSELTPAAIAERENWHLVQCGFVYVEPEPAISR